MGNGPVTFLWLGSHMTKLKVQSDWDAEFWLSIGPSFLPKVTRPFSLLEGGARDETSTSCKYSSLYVPITISRNTYKVTKNSIQRLLSQR